MEVYLNVAETGIGTYGVNAGSERYYGHDASAMSATEAARIAAVLPLPKQRGVVAPKGFTRRYGNSITARINVVGRDGLDACVYQGIAAPVNKAPPPSRKPKAVPGEEYESSKPLPPVEEVVKELPEASSATAEEPREAALERPASSEPEPVEPPAAEAPAEPSTPPQ